MSNTDKNAKYDTTLGIETPDNVPHYQKDLPDFKPDDDGLEETAGTSYEEEEIDSADNDDAKEKTDDLDEYEDEMNN